MDIIGYEISNLQKQLEMMTKLQKKNAKWLHRIVPYIPSCGCTPM